MTKPYLPAVIEWTSCGMAMARDLAQQGEADPARRCTAYNQLVDALGQNLIRKFGARIGQGGSVVSVECCGIRATSVQGLNGALRNWLAKAETAVAINATAAQMGATVQ